MSERARCRHQYGEGPFGPHSCELRPGHEGDHYCCGKGREDSGKPSWSERLDAAEQRIVELEAERDFWRGHHCTPCRTWGVDLCQRAEAKR